MTKKELLAIDIRDLNKKAKRLFEESDIGGLEMLFGNCGSIKEINKAAEECYDEIMCEI